MNALPWVSCERVYAPAVDMEKALRARGLPLFTLETKSPVGELDLIGSRSSPSSRTRTS